MLKAAFGRGQHHGDATDSEITPGGLNQLRHRETSTSGIEGGRVAQRATRTGTPAHGLTSRSERQLRAWSVLACWDSAQRPAQRPEVGHARRGSRGFGRLRRRRRLHARDQQEHGVRDAEPRRRRGGGERSGCRCGRCRSTPPGLPSSATTPSSTASWRRRPLWTSCSGRGRRPTDRAQSRLGRAAGRGRCGAPPLGAGRPRGRRLGAEHPDDDGDGRRAGRPGRRVGVLEGGDLGTNERAKAQREHARWASRSQ